MATRHFSRVLKMRWLPSVRAARRAEKKYRQRARRNSAKQGAARGGRMGGRVRGAWARACGQEMLWALVAGVGRRRRGQRAAGKDVTGRGLIHTAGA